MPLIAQHVLVLLIAAGAAFVLVRQGIASVRGRGSKLGSCCAKGCDAGGTNGAPAKPPEQRIVFMPVDMLRKRQ